MTARSRLSARGLTVCVSGLAVVGLSVFPASAETRGYVVSWFTAATYNQDGDCVGGENLPLVEQVDVELMAAGHSKDEIDTWNKDPKKYSAVKDKAARDLCKIDGKPVNCWVNPAAMPDPHLHPIGGKYAFGFNLDGKGAASPNGFEDPHTHEQGINNQMFRAMGCFGSLRGTDTVRPTAWQSSWELLRAGMPAWLISISGDDLGRDGDATVTFDRALEHVERDATSEVERDMSFRIDSDPRSHVSFPAKIKDGVVTITEHGNLRAVWGEEMLFSEFFLHDTHLRLTMKPDGTLDGILGGYQPWAQLYGGAPEIMVNIDMPGLYWLLRKEADSAPDPKTGQNMDISTAYRIEAVPALLGPSTVTNKTAQAGQ